MRRLIYSMRNYGYAVHLFRASDDDLFFRNLRRLKAKCEAKIAQLEEGMPA